MSDAWLSSFTFGGSVSPNPIPNDGGHTVTVTAGIPDGTYRVYVGFTVSEDDAICYSGIQGQGSNVVVEDEEFTCVVPPLEVDVGYSFFLVNVDDLTTAAVTGVLDVIPHDFRSRMLSLRRILPRNWRMGYRTLEAEEFPQT